ncbi:1-pyrroline-5-carboxylate dehydrogenase [Polaribacter reichenbachii]|uniref:L-glutamate gamma-semialdehyde dehydrogenase n=1 Tax=Polaribacter reichenbachii TaxID=996801 RepID=A0A1B8U7E1_9FLAO|nr:L-glutamate gamma-semialdehyde dehydrogenase [Polaribacter reichenbachii]APZ46495.1 1-pyrroline-5-carboxylate dehydrogenase [Polaribacter reichenbachii]AUC20360.1 1-pyrroline-5-carboxylate dehydrogenase [Polaribacter reichenbachii]OBY67738.1 1-pyrroline-5-carboxylate dehydrogenase [Polaribacter reichenbachii]
MARGFFNVPVAVNEPVKGYAPESPEREELLATYKEMFNGSVDIPMHINGAEVRTGITKNVTPPHDHQHVVGQYHTAEKKHIDEAIETALAARQAWSSVSWMERASIFLKAAELLAGPYRAKMNAATMIAQSKNVHQAEIDAACEMIDFFRFNVQYMTDIFKDQPASAPGIWNRVEYRPLEGFVYAISPFNFTSIAANLPAAAALMGNVVVWKPSDHQAYSAQVIVDLFKEAGLPDGVINVVYGDPVMISDTCLSSPDFSGLHFTGSTFVFKELWKQIGANIHTYKTYPRIVGETGGKDFIWAHNSANPLQVATGITRGAFEYQGQKCSAASRAYIPTSIWGDVKEHLIAQTSELKMGSPENPDNFINAVIHEGSFDKIAKYIDEAKADDNAEIIIGGNYDKSVGYFIEPTVILAKSPTFSTMTTELFGPVMTVYVYEDAEWEASLKLVDESTEYALTGAIFSTDRYIVEQASKALENAAGNFYINDKPTGAVVGQQPFGGARASGTNDKAGSAQNLLRWTSVRLIKETFVTPTDYKYPFLG